MVQPLAQRREPRAEGVQELLPHQRRLVAGQHPHVVDPQLVAVERLDAHQVRVDEAREVQQRLVRPQRHDGPHRLEGRHPHLVPPVGQQGRVRRDQGLGHLPQALPEDLHQELHQGLLQELLQSLKLRQTFFSFFPVSYTHLTLPTTPYV